MGDKPENINLTDDEARELDVLVGQVREECPGQIQSRYLARIAAHSNRLPLHLKEKFWHLKEPLVVLNLPQYADIENTKILLLILGETIGKCVGYTEYNQSYITDIRPTTHSAEVSSGRALLDMHSDLSFATDVCRPIALVLTPHVASDDAPKTLLARAEDLVRSLSPEIRQILEQDIFEIRSGGKLRWPCEQVRRIRVIDKDQDGRHRVRLNFDSITPIAKLSREEREAASRALELFAQEALKLGRAGGHQLRRGQALFIPNDYCLHGRDMFGESSADRLLLRTYVVTEETVRAHHGNTMLSLRL